VRRAASLLRCTRALRTRAASARVRSRRVVLAELCRRCGRARSATAPTWQQRHTTQVHIDEFRAREARVDLPTQPVDGARRAFITNQHRGMVVQPEYLQVGSGLRGRGLVEWSRVW